MPTRMPKGMNMNINVESRNERSGGAWQMWHKNGTRCPKGTVPIRRSTVHDVLRANSLYEFGKKQRRSSFLLRRADAPDVVSGNGHEVRHISLSLLISLFLQLIAFKTFIST